MTMRHVECYQNVIKLKMLVLRAYVLIINIEPEVTTFSLLKKAGFHMIVSDLILQYIKTNNIHLIDGDMKTSLKIY